MSGADNRQLQRFDLEVPVQVDSFDPLGKRKNVYLLSRDLSGVGAFVFTKNPLPVNAAVKLGMILDIRNRQDTERKHYLLIEVAGIVLRAELTGMAIRLGKEFKISPIEREPSTYT